MAVVVLPGVVALDLAVPLQVFGPWPGQLYADLPGLVNPYELVLCGPQPSVSAGPWLALSRLRPLAEIRRADTVLVPGCEDPLVPVPAELSAELAAAADRGARLVSICVGAFVLAAAGVLDGRRATTHWRWAGELRRRYPKVDVREEHLFVDEGAVLTSAGVLAAADVCLHVLRRDAGRATGNAIARFLVSPPHREGGQAQFVDHPLSDTGGGLRRTRQWLLDNLDRELSLREVAEQAHVSVRTLSRRFAAETGETVLNWLIRQRVARARELLEDSDLPVGAIAHRTGFPSVESLRTHFHALVGTSPQHYRRTFRGVPTAQG